jgi:hypothetical protein
MNSKFRKLAIEELEQAHVLVLEIAAKADGVFLWVKLVVASLLAGLRNRDDLSILQQRLRALPMDLEQLYEHMLKVRIDSVYKVSLPRYFNWSMWWMSLIPRYHWPWPSMRSSTRPIYTRESDFTATEISAKCEIMSDRLKSRWAGLIEIRGVHDESGNMGTVQYMHRIIRDFMEITRTWSFLLSATAGTDFKLHKSLLKSIMLHHRLVPTRYIGPDLFATARQALKSAQEACKDEHDPNDDLVLLLNILNTTLNAEYDEKGGVIKSNPPHWSGLIDLGNSKQWPDSFISAAVQYGPITLPRRAAL